MYSIDGYTNYFNNKNAHGGGIAIYLGNVFQTRLLNNLSRQLPHIESLFLEISHPHKFIVGMAYRPPNSNAINFIE